jgi:integrase
LVANIRIYNHQKHILYLTLWTGCRTGELCDAEWRDFDLDQGIWHLKASKIALSVMFSYQPNALIFIHILQT